MYLPKKVVYMLVIKQGMWSSLRALSYYRAYTARQLVKQRKDVGEGRGLYKKGGLNWMFSETWKVVERCRC